MDLEELDELFEDNDEDIVEFINNMRTYTVQNRKNFVNELSNDEFFRRFRLSKETVNYLLEQMEPYLKHETVQYHEINVITQLLLTLRFYTTGSFYITIVGIHKTTAGRIIHRLTEAVLALFPRYVKFPDDKEGKNFIQAEFYKLSSFPKVIGAIDCTHIPIMSPGGEYAEVFRNRKGYFSLNVQTVCDSTNYIMDIICRWPGCCHDSYIFSNSSLMTRFQNGEFGDRVLLDDGGYPLKNYLMTPLPNPNTPAEELYNRAHISTRSVIERTFGILKRRFSILSCGMRCKLSSIQKIITATAILHNIAVLNREHVEEVEEAEEANLDLPQHQLGYNVIQQSFINYFQTLL